MGIVYYCVFFSSRRRHTRCLSGWSSDVCSSDLCGRRIEPPVRRRAGELRSAVESDEGGATHRTYRPSRPAASGGSRVELRVQGHGGAGRVLYSREPYQFVSGERGAAAANSVAAAARIRRVGAARPGGTGGGAATIPRGAGTAGQGCRRARFRYRCDRGGFAGPAFASGTGPDAARPGQCDSDCTRAGARAALPDPALTRRDRARPIHIARARPPEVDFRPLDPGSYGIGLPGGAPIRVTTDPGVFEFSSDNFQLFSPGGDAFGAFCVEGGDGAEGRGIAWMVQRPGAEAEFVVATQSGPRRVERFAELLAALDVAGEPCDFPLADWPGVTASVIA